MNKIKFAIIGYGHIGRRHCAMVSGNEETELVAVADVNPERIDLAKEDLSGKFPPSLNLHSFKYLISGEFGRGL